MALRNREGWSIPDVIDPPESMRVEICIPKNIIHMKAFWGALWELTFWNNWEEDEAHSAAEVARVWYRYYLTWQRQMSELPDCEGEMSCCVDQQVTYRVNPETGLIEQSVNGGTYQPAANTLQSVIVEPVPPVTSGTSATKCDAATNLSVQVQVWIDQVSNDFTTAESLTAFAAAVFEAILAAVLIILSAGVLTPIQALIIPTIGAALTAAWGAGKAAFDAYWTTENKDKILCAAVCNIGADGSFTDAQFSAFWNECNTELPPSPAKMLFMGFLSSVGRQGINAMAATGMSADSDCADCTCGVCPAEWIIGNVDGNAAYGTIDSIVDGVYTVSGEVAFDSNYYCILRTTDETQCCPVTDWVVTSGEVTVAGVNRIVCPNTQHVGNISFGPILLIGSVNYIGIQSASPFTVAITFG